MSPKRPKGRWLLAGLICISLVALAGCEMPWDDDDEEECPYRDDAKLTAPVDDGMAVVQV